AAAATTPLGALVSGLFVNGLGAETIAALYAVSAGLLIYVATGPMMEPLKEISPVRAMGSLGAGVVFALAILALPIHSHGLLDNHDHDHDHTGIDFRAQETLAPALP
ncbi:MAG: hypothetical protein Q8L84_01590, partial [Hyphomonas sp.]|nr:hypothetical protein [Hyphomonas sp.]